MFPIAHAWLVNELVAEPAPAHYLGCVWPDMLFGSPLTHTQSHRSGALLMERANELGDATLRAFVVGALTHGAEPHGFDYYSDEAYGDAPAEAKGYAFQHGRVFAEAAARACGLPAAQGLWKAHNIVEMAFERRLYAANPALGEAIAAACADETLLRHIVVPLASVFSVAPQDLTPPILRFAGLVQLAPVSLEALADVYALQTRLKHPEAQPDPAALAALIGQTERAIDADWQAYLAFCRAQVGALLDAYSA